MKARNRGILTSLQREILSVFASLPDQEQFYLAGGTALAGFYLGHRLSFDLDLFTGEENLVRPVAARFEMALQDAGFEVLVPRRFVTFAQFVVQRNELSHKVDLAFDSPFRLAAPERTELGMYVASYEDLMADKVLAYYGRSEPRDAVDVYFLLQRHTWDALMKAAGEKDTGFDLYWFAVSLHRAASFPDDLERWPVKMLSPLEPVKLKAAFEEKALEIMGQITR